MRKLESIVGNFSKTKVLVVGDVMLDRYILGSASRLSPEVPVPVVRMSEEKYVLGGAANVAANVAALGGKVYLCGIVGKDSDGLRFKEIAEGLGVNVCLYESSAVPTTVKTRVVANKHQLVRVDREERVNLDKKEYGRFFRRIKPLIESTDIVILSDYDKGLFGNADFCGYLIETAKENKKPVLVDPKPVNMIKFCHTDCIAPNLKEAEKIVGSNIGHGIQGSEYLYSLAKWIINEYSTGSVAITCGEDGIFACEVKRDAGSEVYNSRLLPAKAREVYDVSGAGDTALAVIAMSWASGAGLYDACRIANAASGLVVGKMGTATITGKELKANLKK